MSESTADAAAPDGGAGSGDPGISESNWTHALPENIRSDPSIAKYTSLEAFANGHLNAVKMIGKDKITIPETDDQWSEAYNRLGRPESPDGYQYQVPDGFEADQEFLSNFQSKMHELGLSQRQLEGVGKYLFDTVDDQGRKDDLASEQARLNAETELRSEFGPAYNQKMAGARRVIQEFGGDDAVKFFEENSLGNNTLIVKLLASIGDRILEDAGLFGGEDRQTTQGIETQISELMHSDAYRAGDQATVNQVMMLREKLHAAKP